MICVGHGGTKNNNKMNPDILTSLLAELVFFGDITASLTFTTKNKT